LIGGSCGTAVEAAITVASELTEDEMVVVLLPDSGRGYLSKIFNDDWMTNYGFLAKEAPTLAEVLVAKASDIPPLVHLQPEETLERAIAVMDEYSISQVVIAQGNLPLAAAEVKGVLYRSDLKAIEDSLDQECSQLMKAPLQITGVGESIAAVKDILEKGQKLLVFEDGRPMGIVSHSDIIAYLDQVGS